MEDDDLQQIVSQDEFLLEALQRDRKQVTLGEVAYNTLVPGSFLGLAASPANKDIRKTALTSAVLLEAARLGAYYTIVSSVVSQFYK